MLHPLLLNDATPTPGCCQPCSHADALSPFGVQTKADFLERVGGIKAASQQKCTTTWAWDWEIKAVAQAKQKNIIIIQPLVNPNATSRSVDVHLTKW